MDIAQHVVFLRIARVVFDEPVGKDETSARPQHPVGLAEELGLVDRVGDAFDRPHHIEGRIGKFGRGEILEMEAGAIAELHAGRQTIGDFHLLLADGDAVDDGAPLACEPQRAAAEPATGVQHLFARCDAGLVGQGSSWC